ncbi:MAG: MFS transporter [Bacilli bacterium]|nr:MFS transporter [Bacilli bacterium]
MKRKVTLDKKWKEILFGASGFGPNLMMILMGAFYSDAVNPGSLNTNVLQSITGTCLILPAAFSILMMLAKIFDGIIDVPLAALTDGIKSKFGKRRLPIAISFIPMVLSYIALWIPLSQTNQTANTIWFVCMTIIFYGTYTMGLIAFYGSLSTVCHEESQRLRVASFKSFFDTITYIIVYALVPLLLGVFNVHIDKLALMLTPLMATLIIPIFMIKEGEKYEKKALEEGYDITPLVEEKHVGIIESIKLTFTNKPFLKWQLVNSCTFFGLQMFLVSMNALIVGGMGLSNGQMAILNTCAFAPVPIMLYLFNKLKAKKGTRFTYQSCLICFAICIMSFVLGNEFVLGEGHTTLKIIIGCLGGVCGSWSIGTFFMMPYLIPNQVSAVEEKLTGKNHSAMYFAGQALFSSVAGAIAVAVYDIIKNYFITKDFSQIVYAEGTQIAGKVVLARDVAAMKLGVLSNQVFNLGTLVVPFVVSLFCLFGFLLAFKMTKNGSPKELAIEMNLEKEYEENKHLFPEEKSTIYPDESLIVNTALWVLSGSIFGVVWKHGIIKSVNTFNNKKIHWLHWVISILLPPYSAYVLYRVEKDVLSQTFSQIKLKDYSILCLIFGFIGLGIVPMFIIQRQLNKLIQDHE